MTQFCANCGAAIPDGAKFCPSCGRPAATVVPPPPVVSAPPSVVSAPPPAAQTTAPLPPARSRIGLLIGVPVTLIILGIAVWALLTGMPFSSEKKLSRTEQPAPPVVSEQSPGATSTTTQIRYPGDEQQPQQSGAGRGTEVVETTTTAMPVQAPAMPAPTATVPVPTPAVPQNQTPPLIRKPAPVPTPATGTDRTATTTSSANRSTVTPPGTREITESQAEDVLRGYIVSRDYYQLGADCTGIASQGYSNRGYTIDVVDRCGSRGRLGRWRVDTVTREIFVQKADGRYLRP